MIQQRPGSEGKDAEIVHRVEDPSDRGGDARRRGRADRRRRPGCSVDRQGRLHVDPNGRAVLVSARLRNDSRPSPIGAARRLKRVIRPMTVRAGARRGRTSPGRRLEWSVDEASTERALRTKEFDVRNYRTGSAHVRREELAAVAAVLDRGGWPAGTGRQHSKKVRRCAAPAARSHSTTAPPRCTSRSTTLGAGPGDEVIVADYTFPATGHAVRYTGAKPVFADVRPDIWTVDPGAVEAAIRPAHRRHHRRRRVRAARRL